MTTGTRLKMRSSLTVLTSSTCCIAIVLIERAMVQRLRLSFWQLLLILLATFVKWQMRGKNWRTWRITAIGCMKEPSANQRDCTIARRQRCAWTCITQTLLTSSWTIRQRLSKSVKFPLLCAKQRFTRAMKKHMLKPIISLTYLKRTWPYGEEKIQQLSTSQTSAICDEL